MAIGIGTAMLGSSLISGALGSDAASDNRRASNRQYQQTRNDLAPYRDAGSNALGAYTSSLGLGGFQPMSFDQWSAANPTQQPLSATGNPNSINWAAQTGQNDYDLEHGRPSVTNNLAPDRQSEYQTYLSQNPAVEASGPSYNTDLPQYNAADYGGFNNFEFDLEGDKGYQFALAEAMKQANRGMESQGGFNSGNRLAALNDRAVGVASQYANDAFNRQMGTSRENYNRGMADYGIRDERALRDFNIASGQEQDLYGRDQNYLNRLNNLAQSGQNAAGQTASAGFQNVGNQIAANNFGASSTNNAIQQGLSNYYSNNQFDQMMNMLNNRA